MAGKTSRQNQRVGVAPAKATTKDTAEEKKMTKHLISSSLYPEIEILQNILIKKSQRKNFFMPIYMYVIRKMKSGNSREIIYLESTLN